MILALALQVAALDALGQEVDAAPPGAPSLFGLADGLYRMDCGDDTVGGCGRVWVHEGRESICLIPEPGSARAGSRLFGDNAEKVTISPVEEVSSAPAQAQRRYLAWCERKRRTPAGAELLATARPSVVSEAPAGGTFGRLRDAAGEAPKDRAYLHAWERSLEDGFVRDDGYGVLLCRVHERAPGGVVLQREEEGAIRDAFEACKAGGGDERVDVVVLAFPYGDGITELTCGASNGICALFWVDGPTEVACVVTDAGGVAGLAAHPRIHPHPDAIAGGGTVLAHAYSGSEDQPSEDVIRGLCSTWHAGASTATLVEITEEETPPDPDSQHGAWGGVYQLDGDRILHYWYAEVDDDRWIRSCKHPLRSMPPAVTARVEEEIGSLSYGVWKEAQCGALDDREWRKATFTTPPPPPPGRATGSGREVTDRPG